MSYLNNFLLFYAVPVILSYFLLRWNYKVSEPNNSPDGLDVLYMFSPVLNLMVTAIMGITLIFHYIFKFFKFLFDLWHTSVILNSVDKKPFDYRKFFKL